MLAGLKFCGGCNPNYERKDLIEKAGKEFPEVRFEPYNETSDYELVLVVCGCRQNCSTFTCENSRHGIVRVCDEAEYDKISTAITNVLEVT